MWIPYFTEIIHLYLKEKGISNDIFPLHYTDNIG